ncbi:MAG: phage portal protein [Planctomycetaceae bacterium]|jgi:lambda family phage portal protein|nr:phage portal protein [Planctomycetaceae bacterium]
MFNFFKRKPKTIAMAYSPHKFTRKEERAYWGDANSLSANATFLPEDRRKWRNIARYETNCNSYGKGLILTLANIGIGRGPRLQLLTEDENYNSKVEQEFAAWAETINLGEKLKTMRKAKCVDGEAFAIININPKVKHGVKIDLKLIECDRVTTLEPNLEQQRIDGIHFDKYGNPESYDVLKEHPGDISFTAYNKTESIAAEFMLHWFRQDRPEQSRGITELLPSLPLFAQLRRYTLAVIESAETAASISALFTSNGADTRSVDLVKEGDDYSTENPKSMELRKNMGIFLPAGWDMKQIDPKQPTTNYQMFKREILSEMARCLEIPVNIVLGDSSNFNYASGRLDHQIFHRNIRNEQNQCEKVVMFPLFEVFYREGVRVGLFPDYGIPYMSSQYARFYWDGLEHVDPYKEAQAMTARVDAGLTNDSIECANLGHDWEDVLEQRMRELKRKQDLAKKYGVELPEKKENKKETQNAEKESDE